MLRDRRKASEYFDRWIEFDAVQMRETQVRLDSGAIFLPYGRVIAAYQQFDGILRRVIMRYSRGDDLADLREDMVLLLAAREQILKFCDALPPEEQPARVIYERLSFDSYIDWFWWLSLAVCLGMERAHVHQVLGLIGNVGQDALIDRLAVQLGEERIVGGKLKFPAQYGSLLQALDACSQEQQEKFVKTFLDGWYEGSSQAAWYENHHGEDAGYFGYWCFEAALVVKLFGIDDASFCDNPYYPADLVRSH
ncbi:PoNe immunity protein domain-containing protein [Burkholderia ubonensis]|uniref:PoNe immunity protein domain-containing protein n=1 Tax=Burkholderia ubonensis TaxID=101571 RepID=UPI0009B4BF36|nr:PoNe immunity protein domain-containing protein [Burkholderia ubonensis]